MKSTFTSIVLRTANIPAFIVYPFDTLYHSFLIYSKPFRRSMYILFSRASHPAASAVSSAAKFSLLASSAMVISPVSPNFGSPDKSGGKFFNSIENLHLCTMNNQGLLALAQLILPSEILSNFEVVRVEEEASLIRIYLDESVKAEYKENPEIESKGFCEAVTIRDFPIRDKGVDLIVRRRKWYDKQNNRYFSDSYDLKAEETRYSKEFAAFLKGVYGDDSYDLPFA